MVTIRQNLRIWSICLTFKFGLTFLPNIVFKGTVIGHEAWDLNELVYGHHEVFVKIDIVFLLAVFVVVIPNYIFIAK